MSLTIRSSLASARQSIRTPSISNDSGTEASDTDEDDLFGSDSDTSHSNGGESRKRPRLESFETPPLARPSDYLRERCPLCFGGEDFQEGYVHIQSVSNKLTTNLSLQV